MNNLPAGPRLLPSDDPALSGFAPAVRVVSIEGEVEADTVEAGDVVIVMARPGYGPVLRVVETSVDLRQRPDAAPVLITAGAIDRFSPNRATVVAPHTLIGLDDWLVPAAALINGRSISRLPSTGDTRYVQFEMEQHDMVVADGLRIATLRQGQALCRQLLSEGPALDALRAQVIQRLPALEAAGLLPRLA